jgi:hypothetical protein
MKYEIGRGDGEWVGLGKIIEKIKSVSQYLGG